MWVDIAGIVERQERRLDVDRRRHVGHPVAESKENPGLPRRFDAALNPRPPDL